MWSGDGGRAIEKVVGQEVLDKRDRKKGESENKLSRPGQPGDPLAPLSEITCLQPKSSSWLCDSQLTNENCTPTTYFPSEARGRRKEGEEHWRGGIILGRLVETK